MDVDELHSLYGVSSDSELSKKLKLTKGTISKWRKNGISPLWQACFELKTSGKVIADPKTQPQIPLPLVNNETDMP